MYWKEKIEDCRSSQRRLLEFSQLGHLEPRFIERSNEWKEKNRERRSSRRRLLELSQLGHPKPRFLGRMNE